MAQWDTVPTDGGWASSNPPFSEKANAGAEAWNYDSNEPAGSNGGFHDNKYNGDDYNGGADETGAHANEKCFGCGEEGHRRAECPNAGEQTCNYCKKGGHMIKDCPNKPPMVCDNCGQEGHFRKSCENARKVNRDHVADMTSDAAWDKLKQAACERDADDVKEAIEEYVKALGGEITYRQIQERLMEENINLWLISMERELIDTFTNMDLQGKIDKKFSISFRFSDKPERPREINAWPEGREEILSRLDNAGIVVDRGLPKCYNCGELGHTSKGCTQEKIEHNSDRPKISCYNCGAEGHRVRDCPQPRVDKFACKNCGKSGHRAQDCEEPPNMDNVECRKCNKTGHFAKDCPDGGGRACRNCGQEGHIAKECDQPRNMDNVTCRNCEQTGHYSKECSKPRDWSKVQCSNCEEFGHTKVRCKLPPKDSEAFGAQAFTEAAEEPAQPHDDGYADNTGGGGGEW